MLFEQYIVERDDYANAGKVSSKVKQYLSNLGVPSDVLRRIAVACYEAEINMIIHAWGGVINLFVSDSWIIQIVFKDVGPGITDMEKALTPGWSTASEEARSLGFGAGMGLVNIKRVSDEFDIVSSKEGTTLTIAFKVT